jgi:hypothetical protein
MAHTDTVNSLNETLTHSLTLLQPTSQSRHEESSIGPSAAALMTYTMSCLHLNVSPHKCCVPLVVQRAGYCMIRSIVIARAICRVSC